MKKLIMLSLALLMGVTTMMATDLIANNDFSVTIGEPQTFSISLTNEHTSDKSVPWTSSNTSVATVSDAGVVTAVANGTATITATTADGTNLTAQCTDTVYTPLLSNQFYDFSEFENYTVIDQNVDYQTWHFDDLYLAASCSRDYDADDWLITPSLALEEGKTYKLSFVVSIENEGFEALDVMMGNAAEVSALTVGLMNNMELTATRDKEYSVIFKATATSEQFIGFHFKTPDDGYSNRLYLKSVVVAVAADKSAPESVTNLTVTPAAQGALQADVAFTAPTVSIDGGTLSSITKIEILRDDQLVKTFENPAVGEQLSFIDEGMSNGFHTWRVVPSNEKGEGEEAEVKAYVGVDQLGPVTNLKLVYDHEAGVSTLTWDAPTVGVNGGYIDTQNISYTITRAYQSEPIATGYTSMSFEDEVGVEYLEEKKEQKEQEYAEMGMNVVVNWIVNGQGAIYYDVAPVNEQGLGASARTNSVVIGEQYTLPFIESFADGKMQNFWRTDIRNTTARWIPFLDKRFNQDNDNGMMGFNAQEGGETATLLSGNLSMKDASSPVLMFYYFCVGSMATPLYVKVCNHNGELQTIGSIDVNDSSKQGSWQFASIPLTGCAGQDYVQVAFETTTGTTVDVIYLDNFRIIDKKKQHLEITEIPTMTYGEATYELPAITAEGLSLTWTVEDIDVSEINGNMLTIKGAGTTTVTATQAGNDDYEAFSREFTLTVNKAPLTITADDCTKEEGEENPELTVSYEGFVYNDDASSLTSQPVVTTTATVESPAGTYPITASGAESANYVFNYVEGTLTIYDVPLNASVVRPVNNATDVYPKDVVLEWEPAQFAEGYKLYVGSNAEANNLIDGLDVGNVLKYTIPECNYGTIYYWKVVPYNDFGDSNTNIMWTFTTQPHIIVMEFPYSETFNDCTDEVPLGWLSITDNEYVNRRWSPNGIYGFEGNSLYTGWMNAGRSSTLFSPEFRIPRGTDSYISFLWGDEHPHHLIKDETGLLTKQNIEPNNGVSEVIFEVFADGEWHQEAYLSEAYNEDGETKYWRYEKIDLTQYAGKKIQFRWINRALSGAHNGASLDNIYLDGVFEMSNDKIYSENIILRSGRNEKMNIVMENEEPIIMAEFYLQLPEGVTIGTNEDGNIDARLNESRCDQTHTLSVSDDGKGLYHFLCYSNINNPFIGNEGELVLLRLECDENVENGVYQGLIKEILLSDKDKKSIYLNNVTFNIEVRDYLLGDINNNDIINGMDIVEIVDLIMSNTYAIAADLYPAGDPDGVINGMDLVEEVDLVMSQPAIQYYSPMSILDNGLMMKPAVDGSWHLGVDKASRYILAQMTVELEKGERLIDVVSDKTHTVSWKQTDDNHYVVICYSPMNLPFSDNDELLTFICSGNGKISVSDVTLIDDTKQEFIMVDTNADLATGINERNNDTYSSAIHDLQGRLVSNKETRSRQVTKGIYIRNNKKVVIK